VFQEVLRPEFMGRVFSLFFSIALIPSMLGLISTGQIADFIGVNNIFILMGILMVVLGIIAFFIPSMMRLGKIKSPSE
jgi:DHA3 family macrolide efflux protein-like MFS transporter